MAQAHLAGNKSGRPDRAPLRRIADFAQDHLAYTWRDKTVSCSHAGFGRWLDRLDLVSQYQMRRGIGR